MADDLAMFGAGMCSGLILSLLADLVFYSTPAGVAAPAVALVSLVAGAAVVRLA